MIKKTVTSTYQHLLLLLFFCDGVIFWRVRCYFLTCTQRMTLNIKKSPIQSNHFMKIGAGNETWTHTGIPIRPSNVRVYRFRHSCDFYIISKIFSFFNKFYKMYWSPWILFFISVFLINTAISLIRIKI